MPVADGVLFRNNQRSFRVKGKVVYSWMEYLAPYLDGRHTLQEIVEGLGPEKQAIVMNLVDSLATNHFLKDSSYDLAHTLSPTELETYASEIAFIDSFCDSAAYRFERFREQQVLVIGSGLTLTGLVHACLKCGVRQLAVLTTQECETNTRRHRDYLDLFHQGDPRQMLREIETPDWENEAEVLTALHSFDMIVHVSDRPMLARARMLNQLCVTHNKNLLQALLVEDQAWIGPLVRSDANGCWECAWRRLQANLSTMQGHNGLNPQRGHSVPPLSMVIKSTRAQLVEELHSSYAFQDQTTAPISRFIALPTAALVANQLAFEILKYVAEAGPLETAESLIEADLETGCSQKHLFLPHPLCSACHHPAPPTAELFLDSIHQLEQAEPLAPDQFSERVAPCFEERLGLFRSLDGEDFNQLPLSVCKAVVSNPLSQETLDNPPEVIGVGMGFSAARRRATDRACEIYAASLVDRRLLLPLPAPTDAIPKGHTVNRVPAFSPDKSDVISEEWTWAYDLQTRQACLVPASLVYPVLRGLSPLSEAGLGISSGMSWAEAISRALLNLCQHLTITQLENTQKSYPQVDLPAIPLEPEGMHLRRVLDLTGEMATIYDVTGSLQVPTFAICLRDKTVAYSTHVDVAQALHNGLEQAILSWQIPSEQLPVYRGPTLPDLPIALRDDTKVIPQSAAPKDWPDRQLWLQRALEKNGWRAFATPLDHDPALRQVQPYIVYVLLARA